MQDDVAPDSCWNEAERLLALHRYGILDTPQEQPFDEIVAEVRRICDVPVALVSLVDDQRQWFKARSGIEFDETPIDTSVCAIAIRSDRPLVIEDLTRDARTADMSLVAAPDGIRFYAGAPMVDSRGMPLGSLCAIDTMPRPGGLDERQRDALVALARRATALIELQAAERQRDAVASELNDIRARLVATQSALPATAGTPQAEDGDRIIDSALDYAIIATDLEGSVTRWSEGAERIFGWSAREMHGQALERIFTPEDNAVARAAEEMRQALTRGRGNDERWHIRRDGSRFWASGEMLPLQDDEGRVTGFVKVLRDRTRERLREQRLLLLSKASGSLLVANDPDEVLEPLFKESAAALDIDQAYHYVVAPDRAHLRLTHSIGVPEAVVTPLRHAPFEGGPLCGIVARTRAPLIVEDVQTREAPEFAMARRAGIRAYAGFPVESRETLYGVIAFASLQHRSFDAESLGFFGTLARLLSVVRQRLDREARFEMLNASLQDEVIRRTTALVESEDQLRQSLKMEAVGQLTGGIAHDFNNMLAGITGSLELLQRRITQGRLDEVERYIATAQSSARRAAGLTHRLLSFSRRQTLDPKPTSPAYLVEGLVELLGRTVGPSIDVQVHAVDAAWTVLIDRNQLENALLNLCINARDAMPDGGTVTLSIGHAIFDARHAPPADLPPGEYVEIAVADTGTGMDPDVLARAFDPFFTTKPIGQGTGLGLSMVYGFARQSGGQVRIASTVGVGTRIAIYLPRHVGDHQEDAVTTSSAAAPAFVGTTVLIVDDEASIRMLLSDTLADLGYTALEASDGASALLVLQSNARIDLLVSDVGLAGGINGRQLAEMARQRRPGLKVLFVTGYAEGANIREGQLAEGMEILTKPFAMDVLADRIGKLLDGR